MHCNAGAALGAKPVAAACVLHQRDQAAHWAQRVQLPSSDAASLGGGVKVSAYSRKITLATPNYGYEKRQKELAKKRKKEDKLKSKTERKVGGEAGESGSDDLLTPAYTPPQTDPGPAQS